MTQAENAVRSSVKIIAFNLPQFHPIPENDQWWGAGFTEWRNVAKARPLFPGHRQPNLPGELGFYDMRLGETLEQQGELAAWGGIDAFCYYHYWFAGRLLLERPLEILLSRRTPTLPFCLCWANHSWTNHWAGGPGDILVEQTYPGEEDHRNHYEYLRRFFHDERYLRVGGKPVLVLFNPTEIPEVAQCVDLLKGWAHEDGLGGLFLIGINKSTPSLLKDGFDALAPYSMEIALKSYLGGGKRYAHALRRCLGYPRWVVDYAELARCFENHNYDGLTMLPTVIPNWDNTPRIGRRGLVLADSSPDKFAAHLRRSVAGFDDIDDGKERILFIKSWNEWAEGNHLEPDLVYGRGWLQAVKDFAMELKR
jgi:hypothetical protein